MSELAPVTWCHTGAGMQTLGLRYIPSKAWNLHSPGNGALGELDVGWGRGGWVPCLHQAVSVLWVYVSWEALASPCSKSEPSPPS